MTNSPWAGGRYESVGDRIAGIAGQTVAAADRRAPLRGRSVVDLACGTGSAALAAAKRGAHVTGVDLTPELVALAEGKAGGDAVTWLVADAADTGLDDQSFDVAVSNMGIIFVDPDRQVTELRRLLKPDGVLAFSAWRRDTTNPLFDPIATVLGTPTERAFTPDQWGDPAVVASRLADGFSDVEIDEGVLTWSFDSVDAALHFVTRESPIHVDLFTRVDDEQRTALSAAFRDALEAHHGRGVHFDASYVVVTARRQP